MVHAAMVIIGPALVLSLGWHALCALIAYGTVGQRRGTPRTTQGSEE
jgi:hypothetical protein